MSRTIYLDNRRDVDVIRALQRMQRARGKTVVVKHRTLADHLGCSESTVRRALDRLEAAGHLVRTYIERDRGGRLCVYYVRTNVIYRRASMMRRARAKSEQLAGALKRRNEAPPPPQETPGGRPKNQNNKKYKRPARPSIDKKDLNTLMEVARVSGIDDKQRGYLRGAALRYGVKEAWTALKMAFDDGYHIPDLVRVTWGILKNQYPEGVTT